MWFSLFAQVLLLLVISHFPFESIYELDHTKLSSATFLFWAVRCNQLTSCQSWWPWCLGMDKYSNEVTAEVVLLHDSVVSWRHHSASIWKLCQVEEEGGKQSAASLISFFFTLSTAVLLIRRPSFITMIKRGCRSQKTLEPQREMEATCF